MKNEHGQEPNANLTNASQGPRKFEIQIDEDRREVINPHPTGLDILELVHKGPCRYALVQVIPHEDDQFVDPDEKVDLTRKGVEKFVTVQKDQVTIFINGTPVPIQAGPTLALEILKLAGQTADAYDLLEEVNGPPMPVAPGATLIIHGCERFHTQVKTGASS